MENSNPNQGIIDKVSIRTLEQVMSRYGFIVKDDSPEKYYLDFLKFYNSEIDLQFWFGTRQIANNYYFFPTFTKNVNCELQLFTVKTEPLRSLNGILGSNSKKEDIQKFLMTYLNVLEEAFAGDINNIITGKYFVDNTKESTEEFYKRFK